MARPPYGHSVDPLPEEERDQIRALHAAGLGRNEIARQLGRSGRTITVVAHDMGLTFDRAATEAATKARMADLAEKRTILAEALTDDALRLTEQLWQPTVVFNIGGKDNTYTEEHVAQPPADAKKNLVAAAGMAIDRSLRLLPAGNDDGTDAARSLVGEIMSGLKAIAREQHDNPVAADEGAGDAP
ncbi:helix-turn-helix domain-containing protein [Streptomyces sp. NPDC088733]|uniref:helix-turn-helix domain-containing protein n=1 Tax=Streptomyces sp. NPDC088733 TaxID=3365880 RepID=UPI0038126240